MWLYRLKRLMTEREVLIGLVIFGLTAMVADLLDDLNLSTPAAGVRSVGLLLLILLLAWEFGLRPRLRRPAPVPLMLTEETDRAKARAQFNAFVQSANLTHVLKVLEYLSPLQREDLVIRLDRANPRNSSRPADWWPAWNELLREWEHQVDNKLSGEPFASEGRCYHIVPHLALALSFALGGSVGLRRSVILYHYEQERYYRTLDLTEPRCLFREPDASCPPPECTPEDLSTLTDAEKLILHLSISDRHPIGFDSHPDSSRAISAAVAYKKALNPQEDWLPYVQRLWQKASPLMGRYRHIDVCLMCPSVVAFALGMAFSRTPGVTVCHWLNDQYVPVFPFTEIERRLPFD